jgi:transcription antitermination protein NusB
MGERHKAREYALHGLYMRDTVNTPLDVILSLSWVDDEISQETNDFFAYLIKGTLDNLDAIDLLIKKYCRNWSFERIAAVDRAILRLSVFSILHQKDVAPVISINEGIELGKKFGGENSGHFINGILDAVHKNEISS